MTPEYKKGYSRGYQAGRKGRWPDYLPPRPKDAIWDRFHDTAVELRNEADGVCATLSDDDEWVLKIGPRIDAFDAADAAFQNEHLVGLMASLV